MDVETCVTFYNTFLGILILPGTKTIKVICLNFFVGSGIEKLGYEHAFEPLIRPLSRKGAWDVPSPQAMHRFRPTSLYRVKCKSNETLDPNSFTSILLQSVPLQVGKGQLG